MSEKYNVQDRIKTELNERHRKFAETYADCLNATKAYLAVYPDVTVETAGVNGCKLLKNAKIDAYVKSLIAEQRKIRILSIEEAQSILCDIAKNDKERSSDRINALDKLFKSKGQYFEGNKPDTNITIALQGGMNEWSK